MREADVKRLFEHIVRGHPRFVFLENPKPPPRHALASARKAIEAARVVRLSMYAERIARAAPCVVVKRQNTMAMTMASEQSKRYIECGLIGQSDFTGWLVPSGRLVDFELKGPSGRQSPAQEAYQQIIEASGGVYLLGADAWGLVKAALELLEAS